MTNPHPVTRRTNIIAHGHYSENVQAGALPPLKELLRATTGDNVRRIGRFIQLALIGAGRCTQGQALAAETGVYLTSGRGDLEVTIEVMQQMVEHRLPPKPLSFINTVSNSACFYLAKQFGLRGRSHFVTRRHAPLESALQLAVLDLQTDAVPMALVGSVDICTEPLPDHRHRIDVTENTEIGEGSHWFLLTNGSHTGKTLATIEHIALLHDKAALQAWLASIKPCPDNTVLVCGQHVTQDIAGLLQTLSGCTPWPVTGTLHWYDSHCGFALGSFLQTRPAKNMLHIDCDPSGRFNVLMVSLT
jgi:hypothetical protein